MPLTQEQQKVTVRQATIRDISSILFHWLAQWSITDTPWQPDPVKNWSEREWNIAKAVVIIHGMGPLWGYLLTRSEAPLLLPVSFAQFLRQQYRENSKRLAIMSKERDRVIGALSQQQINVLPFKGIELARNLYPEQGCRPMADIDLYICAEDRDKMQKVIKQLDYNVHTSNQYGITCYPDNWTTSEPIASATTSSPASGLSDFSWYGTQIETNNLTLLLTGESSNFPFSLDIHFSMIWGMRETRFDMNSLFHSACIDAKGLSPEITIIYQLLHTTKHLRCHNARWIQLYDIHLLLKQKNIDWQYIHSIAITQSLVPQLLLPLMLTRQLFSDIPEAIEQRLTLSTPRHLRWMFKRICLAEQSCCNPYIMSLWRSIFWVHNIDHIATWVSLSLNPSKQKTSLTNGKMEHVGSFTTRLLRALKKFITKVPRPEWQIFALQNLQPGKDWK